MRFEPSESALIALVASLASSVVWHVWARVALDLSGVEVPLLARGAPGLLAMVIANRGRVKLGTVLDSRSLHPDRVCCFGVESVRDALVLGASRACVRRWSEQLVRLGSRTGVAHDAVRPDRTLGRAPDVARAMWDAFHGAGGRAELVVLPQVGKEAHTLATSMEPYRSGPLPWPASFASSGIRLSPDRSVESRRATDGVRRRGWIRGIPCGHPLVGVPRVAVENSRAGLDGQLPTAKLPTVGRPCRARGHPISNPPARPRSLESRAAPRVCPARTSLDG